MDRATITQATLDPFGSASKKVLAKNTRYKAVVTAGAKDRVGNPTTARKAWYLTTGAR